MEELIHQYLEPRSALVLLGVVAASLVALSKFADLVVDYAVVLSERSGVPKVVIGATVVSLGTTAPEVAVSVLAAFQGDPGLAMGNAVGSIICDTGLILGVACLIRPLTIPWSIANRQGWIQLASGVLLVALSIPWSDPLSVFEDGSVGCFPRWAGFLCLALLAAYLWASIAWSRTSTAGPAADAGSAPESDLSTTELVDATEADDEPAGGNATIIVKLLLALAGVLVSANVLIPAVSILARRVNIPESILAATLVAFGTSLPELVTAVNAARRGHGDLAVGNIIGADILNALFVAGAASAVTSGGLEVADSFYQVMFPAMLFVLVVFRIGIYACRTELSRRFGIVLLAAYLAYLGVSFAAGLSPGH
ncbi:sodium:calcium antiporter [bacterium]|nr:sodium:calcium antiporter [bacterium]